MDTRGAFSASLCQPRSLLPADTDRCGGTVVDALFTGLVDYAPDSGKARWGGQCSRCMAAAVRSDDARVWRIKLKESWRFHDGAPVTARTFVDSWNFAAHAGNDQANSFYFEPIEGYRAVNPPLRGDGDQPPRPRSERMSGLRVIDERTFEVHLAEPNSQFPQMLGHPAFYPVPAAARQDPAAFGRAPVGNGPFRMAGRWQGGDEIPLVRFEDYPGEPAAAVEVTLHVYDDAGLAYEDLVARRLDVVPRLPADRVDDARQRFEERFFRGSGSGYTFLVLPSYVKALSGDRLARALSMAIDREQIIEDVLAGGLTPARSLVAPVAWGAREDPCGGHCRFDPQQARRLYRQAGGLDEPVTLWFNRDSGHRAWVEAVGHQWQEHLGIQRIEYRARPFGRFVDGIEAERVTGPFRHGWVMEYPSIQNYLEPLHATRGVANLDGYSNQRADRLIDRGNTAGDLEEARRLYRRAEEELLSDWHHIPLWFDHATGAHSGRVEGARLGVFGQLQLADVQVDG